MSLEHYAHYKNIIFQKELVKNLFGGVLTNNVVSLVSFIIAQVLYNDYMYGNNAISLHYLWKVICNSINKLCVCIFI